MSFSIKLGNTTTSGFLTNKSLSNIDPTIITGNSSVPLGVYNDGALTINPNNINSRLGAVWIWTRSRGIWSEIQKITPVDDIFSFGTGVDLTGDGNTLLIRTTENLYVYVRQVTKWGNSNTNQWELQKPIKDINGKVGHIAINTSGHVSVVGSTNSTKTYILQ